jgi:hypothetical protein
MRKFIRLFAALLIVLILIVLVVLVWIDNLARMAVERGSTYALGVNTSLNSADIKVLSSDFAMSSLNVSNPERFKSKHFMTLEQGDVALTAGSLMEPVVELPTLTLTGIDMNLEKKDGTSNYKVILENLKRFESKDPNAEPAKKFVVRKVLIKDVNVHVDLIGGGNLTKLDVPIDLIELNDVGSGGKPVRVSDLMGVILKALLTAVVQKGGSLIPGDISGELSNALNQLSSLAEVAKIGEIADIGAKTIGEAGKAAKDIGDATKKGLDETVGGIKDIFGGDKKKKE